MQTPKNDLGGIKYDGGKPRPTLMQKDLSAAFRDVIDVLEMGAKKYARGNYMNVEDYRYHDAVLRHILDMMEGIDLDSESGKHHAAHAICCLLFILQKHHMGKSDKAMGIEPK